MIKPTEGKEERMFYIIWACIVTLLMFACSFGVKP